MSRRPFDGRFPAFLFWLAVPRTTHPLTASLSPAPIEAPPTLAASLSTAQREPRSRRIRCVNPALCKRRMTMAPTPSLDPPGLVRAFRPGRFPERCDPRLDTRRRSSEIAPAFTPSSLGTRRARLGCPGTEHARFQDAPRLGRLPPRRRRPTMRASTRASPVLPCLHTVIHVARFGASLCGAVATSCRGRRPPTRGISSIQRCL